MSLLALWSVTDSGQDLMYVFREPYVGRVAVTVTDEDGTEHQCSWTESRNGDHLYGVDIKPEDWIYPVKIKIRGAHDG